MIVILSPSGAYCTTSIRAADAPVYFLKQELDAALFTGEGENSNYQLNDHLYLIKNTRNITPFCPAPASPGFRVCGSASGATVASPVKFNFSASSFYPIRKMEVWVDGTKRSETYNSVEQAYANPSLSLSAGTHRVTLESRHFGQLAASE